MFRALFFSIIPFLLTTHVSAQNQLQEGIITYSVRIGSGSATAAPEHVGSYTVIVKGPNIRKELRMNSGYQNVTLQNRNTQTAYSLQTASGQSYAIQLNHADLIEQRKPYEDFKLTEDEGVMTLAGQKCIKATVTYKDGSQSSICYSTEWLSPDQLLFDRFPGIRNIPLSFEYKNEGGITMYFTAEKIEAKPVENSLFRVPPDYKMISNSEYKSLRK